MKRYRFLRSVLVFAALVVFASCGTPSAAEIAERGASYEPVESMRSVSEKQSIAIDGVEFAFYDVGSGMPIVLLHGAMASSDSWQHQIVALRDRYRVIAPDFRGHGDSGSGDREHTIELYTADVVSLIDHLSIERAVIVGHSMGGFVVQTMAVEHEDRVRAAVLVDTSYGIRTTAWDTFLSNVANRYMRNREMPSLIEAIADDQGRHDERTRAYLYAAMRRYLDDKDEFLRIWGAVDAFDMKDRLAEITVPTLIVSPRDSSQAKAQAEVMDREIPNSRRVVVTDAGHMVMMDNPGGFTTVVREFLEEADLVMTRQP